MKTINKVIEKMKEEKIYKKDICIKVPLSDIDPNSDKKYVVGKKGKGIVDFVTLYNLEYRESIWDIFDNYSGTDEIALKILNERSSVSIEEAIERFLSLKVGSGEGHLFKAEDGTVFTILFTNESV